MLVPANTLSCSVGVGGGGVGVGGERKNKLILTAGPRHPSLKILSSIASEHLFKKPFYMY